MTSKEKSIVIISGVAVFALLSTTAYVQAHLVPEEETSVQSVQYISWVVPDEYKDANTVVNYDVEVVRSQYQFNPDNYIETDDDNLINYASTVSDDWTLSGVNYVDKEAPSLDTDSKTYMRFQNLGYSEDNKQSALCRGTYAYTGDYCLRMVDGRYLIALGTYYTSTIGQYIDVELEDGTVIPCILGDVKSDRDTDETHRFQKDDMSVMEFIVDSPILEEGGDKYDYFHESTEIEHNFSVLDEFDSKVKIIRVYDKIVPYILGDTSHDNPDLY